MAINVHFYQSPSINYQSSAYKIKNNPSLAEQQADNILQ
jgi:hypothetical protein